MRIITISREFGSGGRELGKRLADILNCDYYDSEIISAVAKNSGLDEKYVENQLNNHGWQNFPITFRSTLGMNTYVNYGNGELLLEQKKVIQDIAKLNKDCVIVGRNADVILKEYNPFNLFICANMDSKIKRCKERSKDGENLTDKELVKKIYPILYVNKPIFCPKLMNDYVDRKIDISIPQTVFSTTKYIEWQYEKEWRIFAGNQKLKLPSLPSCIYLGVNIKEYDERKLRKIADKLQIPVKKMMFIEGKYKLKPVDL